MYHDWPVKEAIVNLPIRLRGNLKHISGNALSSLGEGRGGGGENKDISVASQTLLTGVRLRLRRRLGPDG